MKKIEMAVRTSTGGRVVLSEPHKRGFAYVTINGHVIRKNAVTGSREPPIRIAKSQRDKKPCYAHKIEISGPSQLIYSAGEPIMGCGARLVLIARYSDVTVTG